VRPSNVLVVRPRKAGSSNGTVFAGGQPALAAAV